MILEKLGALVLVASSKAHGTLALLVAGVAFRPAPVILAPVPRATRAAPPLPLRTAGCEDAVLLAVNAPDAAARAEIFHARAAAELDAAATALADLHAALDGISSVCDDD
jgi:hypothetical protein